MQQVLLSSRRNNHNYSITSALNLPVDTQEPVNMKSSTLNESESDNSVEECSIRLQLQEAHRLYESGNFEESKLICEMIYHQHQERTDNLLLLGAINFQTRNYRDCLFYNQQCIQIDPNFAEAYSNFGNALKELGDVNGAIQFYIKAIKLKPRYYDAYNNLASAQIQLGLTHEATETYRVALCLQPNLVDAHCNLGNLYKSQGMMTEAKTCYLEAIRLRPDFAVPWSNLAGLMKEEGQLSTAITYYRAAIRLAPDFACAHSNLGNALKEQGLIEDAMKSYIDAIKLRPDFAIAYGNLASCYFDMGQMELAISCFRYAIRLEPNFPDAYNNLGNALREKGEVDAAINCYCSALKLKPDHPYAYNNLGNAMKDKGLVNESIQCYLLAIRLMPTFAAAHSNLGSVLKEQGKLDQALAYYGKAISIDPKFADAYSNMGNAYKDLGRLQDALRCYSAAIKAKPTFADAYSNLASTYKDGGHLEEAINYYRRALELKPDSPEAFANLVHSLNFICDWSTREQDFIKLRKALKKQIESSAPNDPLPSVQPFHALVYPLDLAEMRQISEKYAERALFNVKLLNVTPFQQYRKRPNGSRIHVGYVSSDLGNHPLSHLMQSVFGMHNKEQFQVTCYALSPNDHSIWRRKIETEVERIVDISSLAPSGAARLIHNDNVDVLINLNGYTKGARNEIFALRPAPVQVSYMGFCGTMGADYIQYMVADHIVIQPPMRPHYTEKILYMPFSYFVNDHKQSARYIFDSSTLPTRSAYQVPEDKFVFCNFNQIYKIDPKTFDVWMSILRRVPDSILWLLRFPPAGESNIRREAKKRGVGDSQLHFTNVAPKPEHIKRGLLADLFLDTLSCNAHTTGCDILWSGTPMLTKAGEKMASRVASSLLNAVGIPEFITNSMTEYEEFAVELGNDRKKMTYYREKLRVLRHSTPLFDTLRWVRSFEGGLKLMFQRYQEGRGPADMDAPDVKVNLN